MESCGQHLSADWTILEVSWTLIGSLGGAWCKPDFGHYVDCHEAAGNNGTTNILADYHLPQRLFSADSADRYHPNSLPRFRRFRWPDEIGVGARACHLPRGWTTVIWRTRVDTQCQCLRAISTSRRRGREHGCHFGHPSSRPCSRTPVHTTRERRPSWPDVTGVKNVVLEHGPSTKVSKMTPIFRAVSTYRDPCQRAMLTKNVLHDNTFFDMACQRGSSTPDV